MDLFALWSLSIGGKGLTFDVVRSGNPITVSVLVGLLAWGIRIVVGVLSE